MSAGYGSCHLITHHNVSTNIQSKSLLCILWKVRQENLPNKYKVNYHQDIMSTYLENIVRNKTCFLACHCCGFHECIYFRIWFYSCFFFSSWQFCQQFISCSNSQTTSWKVQRLSDCHFPMMKIMLANVCTSSLRNKFW